MSGALVWIISSAKNGEDTGNVLQWNAICSALLQLWMVELIAW